MRFDIRSFSRYGIETDKGELVFFLVYNAPKMGTLKVMKTADDGKVSGRRFHLYGKADSGTVIDLYADTDVNGVATFSDVEIGKGYTIEEVGTPEWYIIPEPQTVDIEYGKTVEASFNNALKRGDLVVHKTSEDDKIEGRTFRLHGTSLSGEIVDMTASTDATGTAYFNDIPIGNGYILEETGTPEWYIVPASVTVDITENATVERSFENILKRGSLKVTKTSFDGLVEGLQFRLTGTSLSGIPVDVTVATDSNGIAIFENILIGSNYRLEEVGTPNYYIIPDMQNANITWNDVTVTTFYNDAKRGDLTVHKTSEDDEVEGRRFHLYGISDANIPVDEYATTDLNGYAYFRDILIGQYTLEEVDTPEKYIVPAPQTVTIGWDETVEASFCNELKRGTLEIVKNSEDGLAEGVRFHLYGTSLKGDYIDLYAVTDASGIARFENILISGETPYTVEEVDTDIRYVIPEAQDAPIEWAKVTRNMFENRLKKWRVTVTKVDIETTTAQGDAKLAGAVYGIYENGELVDTYTTDENGQFTSDYYVCGDNWTLREISPSEGYLIDDTVHHIGAENTLYEVEYNDTENRADEQVMYGNIAVIKHTDNGDTQIETPEVGSCAP